MTAVIDTVAVAGPIAVPVTTATILVVDDSPENLTLMHGMLKDAYRVRAVNSTTGRNSSYSNVANLRVR